MFFLELIVWHVDCNFGNPAEKFRTKMKLSQPKYKKDKKICTIFKKNCFSICRLDTQVQYRQLCRYFPARSQETFHSKSGTGITIPSFWKKEISSSRSSVYVECSSDKTDKIILPESSKMTGSKSSNQQKIFLSKRNFFFKTFLQTGRFVENFRKTMKKILLRVQLRKNFFFQKHFFQETRSSGQLKCSFEHLAKTFLPNVRRKVRL